jgi:hypothetical protein
MLLPTQTHTLALRLRLCSPPRHPPCPAHFIQHVEQGGSKAMAPSPVHHRPSIPTAPVCTHPNTPHTTLIIPQNTDRYRSAPPRRFPSPRMWQLERGVEASPSPSPSPLPSSLHGGLYLSHGTPVAIPSRPGVQQIGEGLRRCG